MSVFPSINRTVGPSGPFFPSCIPGTLLNSATYAQALSQVATLKGKNYSHYSANRDGDKDDVMMKIWFSVVSPRVPLLLFFR